jgi:hypothetical protein
LEFIEPARSLKCHCRLLWTCEDTRTRDNRSLMSRPLKGDAPTVDLVLGYKRLDESVARAFNKSPSDSRCIPAKDYELMNCDLKERTVEQC